MSWFSLDKPVAKLNLRTNWRAIFQGQKVLSDIFSWNIVGLICKFSFFIFYPSENISIKKIDIESIELFLKFKKVNLCPNMTHFFGLGLIAGQHYIQHSSFSASLLRFLIMTNEMA